jgi:hypothetical protein
MEFAAPLKLAPMSLPLASNGRKWFMRLANGRQYGPVNPEVIRSWQRAGHSGPDNFVASERDFYRTPDRAWKPTESIFPAAKTVPDIDRSLYQPRFHPLVDFPERGLLNGLSDTLPVMSAEEQQFFATQDERIKAEVARSEQKVKFLTRRILRLRELPERDATLGPPTRLVASSVGFYAFEQGGREFYMLLPYGALGQMPHEFFSLVPGGFEYGLVQESLTDENGVCVIWRDDCNRYKSPLLREARIHEEQLSSGLNWRWLSDDNLYEMLIVWGVQIIPLGPHRTMHLMQTSMHGALRRTFGIDWYVEKRFLFRHFRDSIAPRHSGQPHFIFSSTTAQLLCRLNDLH